MIKVFRPKGNLVWAGLAFVLDVIFLTQAIFYPTDAGSLVLDLAIAIFVAAAAYLLWVKPKLVFRENDLIVVNPFKKATIDYSNITELKTKWVLQIDYSDTSIQVWVAPANGKGRWIADSTFRWRNNRVPLTEGKTIEHTSISQSLVSDSGIAASLIRERMNH